MALYWAVGKFTKEKAGAAYGLMGSGPGAGTPTAELNVVTGAFGYTGQYITRRLLSLGKEVRTLTGHPRRENPFGQQVAAFPLNFDNPEALRESLRGATVLYNTYWVRFPRGEVTFERAVENSRRLLRAAKEAGVGRIVHISIVNASRDSPLAYFRGKGLVEDAIFGSPLSYAILRPTVIFGLEDVLINNIAWLLRRFPLFALPGGGDYRLQPVFVEDVAELAVQVGQREEKMVIDAVGPETYTFKGLVRTIAHQVGSRARIVHAPPGVALPLVRLLGYLVKDVVLTRDEVKGLMMGLLVSAGPATGWTRFSQWLEEHGHALGRRYASELERHYR